MVPLARAGLKGPVSEILPRSNTEGFVHKQRRSRSSCIFATLCADQPGIVATGSTMLAECMLNTLDADEFNNQLPGCFFICVHLIELGEAFAAEPLRAELAGRAELSCEPTATSIGTRVSIPANAHYARNLLADLLSLTFTACSARRATRTRCAPLTAPQARACSRCARRGRAAHGPMRWSNS
jgi:hypothetical protein